MVGLGAVLYGVGGAEADTEYTAIAAAIRERVSQRPKLQDLVRFATLAANGHNTQPWRFGLGNGRIDIRPDLTRRTPVVDPDDHHLFVSLGCAAENLAIAGASVGHPGDLRFDPDGDGSVVFEFGDGVAQASPLFEAIPQRQSTRTGYDGRQVSFADMETLAAAASIPGVALLVITDRRRIERIGELVVSGNSAQMDDAAFVRELETWLRFNPRQALRTRDGLYTAASGNPTAPTWLGGLLFDLTFRAQKENKRYLRQLRSSAAVAVFASERNDKDHWMRAGRACQRFALQATALGIKHAFVNQPVEVPSVRSQLAAYLGLGTRRPDLLMRFGYGPELPKSLRRPVEHVLIGA